MFGVEKKVEAVRTALHDAFVARANEIVKEPDKHQHAHARVMILLDLADIIRRLAIKDSE